MNRCVLYSLPKAFFHIFPDVQTEGTFILSRSYDEIFCEWQPNGKIKICGIEYSPELFHIGWRLCEVVEIVKEISSMESVTLQFLFEDSSQLPLLTFKSKIALASIKHLFQFLKSKLIVEKPETNHYYINLRYYERKIPSNKFITHSKAVYISEHLKIMKSFGKDPIVRGKPISFAEAKKDLSNLQALKAKVMTHGLDEESRWFVWLYLLGIYDPNKSYDENIASITNNNYIYESIRKSWNNIPKIQMNETSSISKLANDVMKDVKRTDRNLEQFSRDDHPNLSVLNNVLVSYAMYCKDTGFVQGMGDIVSLFIILYIKSWDNEKTCNLVDGRKVDKETAENLIFQILCKMMTITQQDRMFTDLLKQQEFAFERVFDIIKDFHPNLAEWLQNNQLQNLIFLYRHIILLFKREFKLESVLRLWDAIFSHEKPFVFIRYFCAAILINSFPQLIVSTSGAIEEVMNFIDEYIRNMDVEQIIGLSIVLYERYHLGCTCDPLPSNSQFINYKCEKLKLITK